MKKLPTKWIVAFAVALFSVGIAGGTQPNDGEIHHGYGGYAITPPAGVSATTKTIEYGLENYHVWGNGLLWRATDHALSVSLFTVLNAQSSTVTARDKPIVLAKWKTAYLKDVAVKQLKYKELPYTFGDSKGYEFHTTGTQTGVTRVFFINTSLFVVSLSLANEADKVTFMPLLDSFRLLTKDERVIALIKAFDPPPLPQERPTNPGVPETEEMGLKNGVSRVRDTTKPNAGKSVIIQQIHFDPDGFKTKEISFIDGFPDLITAWGWSAGKRVNYQSAVNYPDKDLRSYRPTIVSGSTPVYDPEKTYDRSKYGNTIETQLNSEGRPLVRKVFSNNGSLIYVEKFQYKLDSREINTTDSSGGFIGRIRELFDKEQNIIERQMLGDDGSLFSSTKFEYSFDEKKNWVEKREVVAQAVGRGKVKKVIATYFRDILYYDTTIDSDVALLSAK